MYLTFVLPFAVWTLRGFLLGVPQELEEAAMVDGTTRFGAFVRILLPLLGPGLVATSIFAFIQAWNEFIIAYVFLAHPGEADADGVARVVHDAARNGLGPADGRRDALRAAGRRLLPARSAADRLRADGWSGARLMAEIQFVHVSKVYGDDRLAVRDLNLTIAEGEFVVLVGPSGCGKTTALRMVAGLEEITAGEIRIGERVVNDLAPRDRDVAMVFQNYALYPHKTVYENLAFGLRMRKVPKDEQRRRVEEIARILGLQTCSTAGPPSFPADSASASRWAARSCASRRRSSWTSRCRTSTPSYACRCVPRSRGSSRR